MERLRVPAGGVEELVRGLRPSSSRREDVRSTVADIVDMVRNGGDDAVRRLTLRLDEVDVPGPRVSPAALNAALVQLDPEVRSALELLAENVRAVAAEMVPRPARVELAEGQVVSTRQVPVRRAGVYVPGGPEIAACSPPGPSGLPHATALAVCRLLGVDEVYAVGGSQAVAAMSLGTESIPAVDLVVGPGNAYVEEAKRGLFGEVGIESLAGPSELVVVADASAPVEPIAWDLRAQAEHGAGARSLLVSADATVLAACEAALRALGADGESIALVEAESWECAYAFVNAYAPEHLQLAVLDPAAALEQVRHAGAVFLGASSGTVFGDYVAGANHVLPTGGSARFSSGLSPHSFLRLQEVIEL